MNGFRSPCIGNLLDCYILNENYCTLVLFPHRQLAFEDEGQMFKNTNISLI